MVKEGKKRAAGDGAGRTYRRGGKHHMVALGPALTEDQDREMELAARLQEALSDCSRQRLRALQMALRRYGNLDCRIQSKDLQSAFQESNIKLSSRTFQIIAQKFGDQNGIDYEQVWSFLRKALYNTGRDSIRAILASNITDTSNYQKRTDNDRDRDLIERLKEQLDESEFAPNLDSLRAFLREHDTGRCGNVSKTTALDVVKIVKLPVYGSLLKSVISRCDTERNGQVSWPEMMNLLETAWTELKTAYPDVANRHYPKEPTRPTAVNLSGIQKRLLKKGTSISNSETITTAETREQKAVRPPSAAKVKVEGHAEERTEVEEEKRPSSRGGFFKSVRGFLGAGKKKQPSPERAVAIPVIQVEKETKSQIDAQTKRLEGDDFIEVMIKDKSHKIWCPDNAKSIPNQSDPPKERLKLDWIHGYGGRRDGSTIVVTASHEIVYHIGNTVVLHDFDKHHQRHYREHTEEIRALAVHSDGVTIATGQCTSKFRSSLEKAHIRVWRSDTLQTTKFFGSGMIHLSITFLAFVPDKNRLVSIDQSLDREIALWDLGTGTQISKTKLNTEMVCILLFHPSQSDLIITGGKEHLTWWKVSEKGVILQHGKAIYGSHLRPRFITCATHNEKGDLITGDSNGTVYVWNTKDHRLLNMVKHAHAGPVLDLIVFRNSVISSGKDHNVKNFLMDKYMDSLGNLEIPESYGCVRILRRYKGYLLMGTTFNSILYFEMNKKGHPLDEPLEIGRLTHGSKSGVQCLLPLFSNGFYLSIGRDSAIDIYDAQNRKSEWHCALEGLNVECADASLDGSFIVLATKNGTAIAFKIERKEEKIGEKEEVKVSYHLEKVVEETQINEWRVQPSFVKISPDKSLVAIAALDFNIYLARTETVKNVETEEECQVFVLDRSVSGHQAVIIGLDWSASSPWILRSYDEDNNTKFWNLDDLSEQTPKQQRNQEWTTENCRNSFKMAGVWKTKTVKQSGMASLCVSQKKSLVVIGDNDGFVSMSRYPASNEGPFTHTYKCSLNRVQLLAFCPDDSFVISNSDDDVSLMQWKVL